MLPTPILSNPPEPKPALLTPPKSIFAAALGTFEESWALYQGWKESVNKILAKDISNFFKIFPSPFDGGGRGWG
jgi:hypothetical protein